jgi:hypothetical protein
MGSATLVPELAELRSALSACKASGCALCNDGIGFKSDSSRCATRTNKSSLATKEVKVTTLPGLDNVRGVRSSGVLRAATVVFE